MMKEMRFVISYKKKPLLNDPKHQILISVFYVERDEKPSMKEILKIVEKHSGDDFIADSIALPTRIGTFRHPRVAHFRSLCAMRYALCGLR